MTVYGFSDNLTSPVAPCLPATGNPKQGCRPRKPQNGAGRRVEPHAEWALEFQRMSQDVSLRFPDH